MTIDFSYYSTWIWTIIILGIAFVALRFFFHIVVGIFRFVMSFFWHGVVISVVLLLLYFVLHALQIL